MFIQFGNMLIGDRETCCLSVAAEALEEMWRSLQSQNNVKMFLAARRTATDLSALTQYKGRASRLLGQLARDQADNAFGPVFLRAVDQNNLLVGLQLRLLADQ